MKIIEIFEFPKDTLRQVDIRWDDDKYYVFDNSNKVSESYNTIDGARVYAYTYVKDSVKRILDEMTNRMYYFKIMQEDLADDPYYLGKFLQPAVKRI